MKKILSTISLVIVLLCSMLLIGCSVNNGNEVNVDGILYKKITYVNNGESQEVFAVAGCKSGITVLNIAAEVNGLPVYLFEKLAFKDNLELKEVIIPDSIDHIALQTSPFML